MRPIKLFLGSLVAAGLVAAPVTSAWAGWHGHGGGRRFPGLFGIAGALVGGAAAIATAPLAIIAGAGSRGYRGDSSQYDEAPRGYPARQAENYPPPGYAADEPAYGYQAPPRGYYAQQQAQNYAPRYPYRGQPQSGYDENPRGYYPPRPEQAYSPRDYDGPPPGYAQRQRYYDYPPGY